MATIVIVHGGCGGGWEWTEVADLLRARGHRAFTPTLTGMGERAHLAREDVGLATHVQDLVGLIESEDLRDVVLCAASYGGMPATGAADRVPRRVRLLVYIDALVPRDGQAALELLPKGFAESLLAAKASGAKDWWRVRLPPEAMPPEDGIDPARRARYVARIGIQPARTFLDPLRLDGAVEHLPRAFVRCTGGQLGGEAEDPIAPFARRARAEGWPYREMPLPHDPHLFDPEATAGVLHGLALTGSG